MASWVVGLGLGLGLGFFVGRLGSGWSHGSFRVQQVGLLPVIGIEYGTAVYRIDRKITGPRTEERLPYRNNACIH